MHDENRYVPFIYASEIGQYHYCAVSWYLQKCGYKPKTPTLKKGKTMHHSLGKILMKVEKQHSRSKVSMYIGISCFLLAILFYSIDVIL